MTSKNSSASSAAFTQLELEGKSYKLSLNFDAMCLWESLTGKGAFTDLPKDLGSLQGGKLILFVTLQKYHGAAFNELKSVDQFYKKADNELKMFNIKAINDALAIEFTRSWGLGQQIEEAAEKKELKEPTS